MTDANTIRAFLYDNDELRRDEYGGHPLAGHCYVASEAYFHLHGGYDEFKVKRVKHEGTTHWFLERRSDGKIIDLTSEQFETPVPYDEATATGFLTDQPSARAEHVIEMASTGVKF